MGSSESKIATVSTPKPDPNLRIKNLRVAQLVDPRSPSTDIDRTPIQMAGAVSKTRVEELAGSSIPCDPRSPTHGISRTPLKDSVSGTVSSFARRLGMLFLNESSVDEAAPLPQVTFTKHSDLPVEELGFTEPLLTPYTTQDSDNGECITIPSILTPSQGYGSMVSSPFVLIGEVEVQADLSLEEAEDALLAASSPPLKRELSLSLLTCHDGVHPSQVCENEDGPLAPPPTEVTPSEQGHEDHLYALPIVSVEPVPPVSLLPVVDSAPEPEVFEAPVEEPEVAVTEVAVTEEPEPLPQRPSTPKTSCAPTLPTATLQPEAPTTPAHTGIRCPSFDTKSPSQVVFKPQWLGLGFGATGVKPRGLQGRGKGGSSPLASRKPAESENKGLSVKPKQRGKALASDGRSPLQVLRETNSPRENSSQMKLKISTPDRQRLGQLDRRTLIQSLNKENQR
ncbi:cell division cycle-associated protein 3 isoform X2 [Clupea harengus]|uniref:Cell division cycle-associated protein 3 isoform X2 n=1 Tax=Clupea harengus TaxID=7950 RepID=A0A6P8FW98_CLUHA|nr:cell division cycle-associated protein 3 isoform X2 [Clupea harengus]